jgi:MoaA/NifB/PqqE/SkfB family radical SAM enzyme
MIGSIRSRLGHAARNLVGLAAPAPKHGPYAQLLAELQGLGADVTPVQQRFTDLEQRGVLLSRYDALVDLLDSHPTPHWANYLLVMEEYKNTIDDVRSYPCYVWMDISSICSVECRFCKYTHEHLPRKSVSLEKVQAIEWLKYVRLLNLTAGTAEAITNPQFIDIFEYLQTRFPHLNLSFLTNGRTLNERILRTIAGRLDQLHVSMNASSEEAYNHIIASGNWHQFSRNMRLMREAFRGQKRPSVTASFVLTKSNIHRVVHQLEFAAEHGAATVLFHHYYPHYVSDLHSADQEKLSEKFGYDESLYFHKELSDHWLGEAEKRARELGVQAIIPPPFAAKAHISFGCRSASAGPTDCVDPWTKLYLLWGFKSKREEVTICCGLASDLGVYFDRDEIATRAGLFKVRNSPTLRAYRRTVNGGRVNPICAMCRTVDRFAPDAVYPDQRTFFTFNDLPVPPHFQDLEQPWPQVIQLGIRGQKSA